MFGTRSSVYLRNYFVGIYARLSHSYGESFVRGIKNPFRCKEYLQSMNFVGRIEIMFGNRSSVRKGGHTFVGRIDILPGNRSSVRTEDR